MLIQKDHDNEKCLYECDRCKRVINTLTKINILTAGFGENPRIKWNLCPQCYKALERGIEKSKKIMLPKCNVK